MKQVNYSALKDIPYLDIEALGDRKLLLMQLWDGEQWHQWFPSNDGTLIKGQIVDVVQGYYVGKKAALSSDLWVPFIEFMWQRLSWPEVEPLISALCDDFSHMGTSIAKLKHLFHTRDACPELISAFVQTELEYFVTLARTIFDLLQEILSILWNERIQLLDPTEDAKKKQKTLPATFSKIALKDKKIIKTPEEIVEKYSLPLSVAEEYVKQAPFFIYLRAMRDKVIHGGDGISSIIFVTEKGFCISKNERVFSQLDIWHEKHQYNENLISLLPWLAYVISNTTAACSDIIESFAKQIRFPSEIAPGYQVFIRDPNNSALIDMLEVEKGNLIWWN